MPPRTLDLLCRIAAGASRMLDEAIQKLAELPHFGGIETADDLGVAAFDHLHHTLPDALSLGREREHDASAIGGARLLAHQPLVDQRLRGATGLALVQVGPLR